ncbi:MAG: PAS domain S-box protein [Arcobacteraceae bacterium]|nr:PAS domain S-box protein [Arcobacteraceae bacterium]
MDVLNLKDLVEKTKKLKVLYVEDNKETRLQALKILDNFFDHIDIAVDGADGLNQYRQDDDKYYDLVISDINMPNMNGVDMSKAILDIYHHQNILIVSAYNDSEQLQELIDIGISNYIHKPVRMDTLINALQKTLIAMEQKTQEYEEFNKIQALNHELDALVDSFDTYVIASRTDLKGVITYASKAYQIISGYKESELLGKPHNIVRHPDMPAAAFKDMWDTIQQRHLWVGEVKNLRKDGTYYWVKANIAPYYDKNKNHIGYSAIRIDITAQKEVEKLHSEVNNLLNNAGQGFLSFDKNMKTSESFSKECLSIFQKDDIYKHNISDLLFGNDAVKKELFDDGISRILNSDEDMIKEMFLSLLPKEHTLNEKDIKIEYKLLPDDKFMLVLTDITNTKKLKKQIKEQNQIQKMIVSVASDKNDFIELKFDFENFILNPSKDLKTLLRELHTFKGVFAQKEMVHIVYGIHDLETKINKTVQNDNVNMQHIIEVFKEHNLRDIFDIDLEIIGSALGDEFLEASCSLNIDTNSLDSLESKIKQLKSVGIEEALKDILYDFEKLRYESIYTMLNTYPTSVKQMAQILEKEIYPLEIMGDKDLSVTSKFKPFMKSLIHLFNNCVDHGIEDVETRVKSEKDEIGTISCDFLQINDDLQIIISDDGAGINIDKLSTSAIKNGIKTQDELDAMSEDEKLLLVFADSLSTKEELSISSGRGVGMSAIKSEIEKLYGNIEIKNNINKSSASTCGCGVKFIFTLPLDK